MTRTTEAQYTFLSYPLQFYSFIENPFVCEIMWKNCVDSERPQISIWRMHVTCWITEARNIQSIYKLTAISKATFFAPTPLYFTFYKYILYITSFLFIYLVHTTENAV